MATPEENAALARALDFAKNHSQYYRQRLSCIDGARAQGINDLRSKGVPQPDVGVICLELLKHSADVQADPAAKAARPDQDLLAPYRHIAQQINQEPTDANAIKILNMYLRLSNEPGIQNLKAHETEIPVSKAGQPAGSVTFRLRPESALDAAFVATWLNADSGKPLPQSPLTSLPPQSLESNMNGVYSGQLNIGESRALGEAQGILKFRQKQR